MHACVCVLTCIMMSGEQLGFPSPEGVLGIELGSSGLISGTLAILLAIEFIINCLICPKDEGKCVCMSMGVC